MNPLEAVALVALGTGLGAVGRYVTDRVMAARLDPVFPWATLVVNIVGCFILGFLAALVSRHVATEAVRLLLAVGFCGGLTTFSTFGYETTRLAADGSRLIAFGNVAISVVGGLLAAALGLTLGA